MKKLMTVMALLAVLMSVQIAEAQTDDAQFREAVAEYLKAANTKESMTVSLIETFSAEELHISDVDGMVNEIMDSIWEGYIDDLSGVLKRHFTIEDINQITEFYKSPVGKKYAQYLPKLVSDCMQEMMAKYQDKMTTVVFKYININ